MKNTLELLRRDLRWMQYQIDQMVNIIDRQSDALADEEMKKLEKMIKERVS